jgi:hypothetical protein
MFCFRPGSRCLICAYVTFINIQEFVKEDIKENALIDEMKQAVRGNRLML